MSSRRLTLRTLLAILGAAGALYVFAVAGYLALVVRPEANALRDDTRVLLTAHQAAAARIDRLHDAVMGGESLLRGRREGMTLPADTAALLRARVDAVGDTAFTIGEGDGIPVEVRRTLQRATEAEGQVVSLVTRAIADLEAGRVGRAIESLVEADGQRTRAEEELLAAQAGALSEVLSREQALQSALSRTVELLAWWGLAGTVLVLVSFVVLRKRLYQPMAALEASLDRAAGGDLSTRAGLAPGDEMGRLGALFDHMTGVLQEREQATIDRHRGIIDRYRKILEESAAGLIAIDADTMTVAQANKRAQADLGVDEAALLGRPVSELWRADHDVVGHVVRDVAAGGAQRGVFLADQVTEDGNRIPVEVTVISSGSREAREVVAVVHDLTERRRLERVHERLARFALDRGSHLRTADRDQALGEITELAAELLGVRRSSVWLLEPDALRCTAAAPASADSDVGRELRREDYPEYIRAVLERRTLAVAELVDDERTRKLAADYLTEAGVRALLDVPVRVGGDVTAVLCNEHVGQPREWLAEEQVLASAVAEFVSQVLAAEERRGSERALRASEARYRTVFERALVGIAEIDPGGRFEHVNAHFRELLGYSEEELRELTWRDVTHVDDRARDRSAAEAIRSGALPSFKTEKRYIRKDGLPVWVEVHVGPVWSEDGSLSHFISVSRDLTEERDLREQLAHAQRMDSVGRLAGGIAHDFNNLLTAVLGNVELARGRARHDEVLDGELAEVEQAAQRATSLTRQLLTFARRQVVTPSVVELDALADGAERLLRRLIGENVELVTDLDAEGAMILIDPRQFDQVLMNLTVNARDAMPDGGTVRIASRVARAGELPETAFLEEPAEEYVVLEVRDSGSGMTPEVQDRVFEPFFTTKEPGEGTGLGLATCYGIVHQADGHIGVTSEPGVGSVFRVVLPRVRRGVEPVVPTEPSTPVFAAGRTVLVIEDADPVRRLVVEALGRAGYSVLEASDGEQALAVAGAHEGAIDVVVSDIVMPKMNGPRAVEALRETRPEVRALFISGYAADTVRDSALSAPGSDFLAKPFSAGELLRKVSALTTDGASRRLSGSP